MLVLYTRQKLDLLCTTIASCMPVYAGIKHAFALRHFAQSTLDGWITRSNVAADLLVSSYIQRGIPELGQMPSVQYSERCISPCQSVEYTN